MSKVNDMLADYFKTCGDYDHFIRDYGDVKWVSVCDYRIEYSFIVFLENGTVTTTAQHSDIQSWLWSKMQ